jgi:hypothetical protein
MPVFVIDDLGIYQAREDRNILIWALLGLREASSPIQSHPAASHVFVATRVTVSPVTDESRSISLLMNGVHKHLS